MALTMAFVKNNGFVNNFDSGIIKTNRLFNGCDNGLAKDNGFVNDYDGSLFNSLSVATINNVATFPGKTFH